MGIGFIYEELKWPEIKQVVNEDRVVSLPTGSIEQHGPHLPVGVKQPVEKAGSLSL